MRVRLGLVVAAILATLFSPITPQAQAFSGFASAPLNVTQTAISGGIQVGWSAPTDVDTGVTGYRVEYSSTGIQNSWVTWETVTATTYSSNILGLPQSAYYVRVAALTNSNANTGIYGYPWTKLYSTTALNRLNGGAVSYETGYGLGASDPYTTLSGSAFTRVRWRVDTTISGVTKYAEADAYEWVTGDSTQTVSAFAPSVSSVMVPSVNSPYQFSVQANVTDLNVYSDNAAVTNGKGLSGRLEIWPWNYSQSTSGLSGVGSASTYDYDDTNNGNGTHGSFQIHDMTNLKPVFVWNDTAYGAAVAFNYGKNSNVNGNPDWTFCSSSLSAYGACPTPSAFKLQIFVNIPITPLADTTAPTVTRVDARTLGKSGDTITVKSTELGTVYLVSQTVSVTNYSSIANAASYLKTSVSISSANTNTTLTLGYQSDGLYNLYAVDLLNNVSTGILATVRIDNTAPTASSIAVGSTGTIIQITANETITNTLQVFGIFAASDSGSAITINSVGVSGKVATLGLSRAIPAGATVYFSYTPASGAAGGRIVDLAGNEMAAITTRSITNNSTSPITVTLTVPDPISKGVSITASVSVSVAGKVTFYLSGKRIAGCLNKVASGTTPITVTCTFKPALSAQQTIAATLIPTLSAYPNTSSTVDRFILKRATLR